MADPVTTQALIDRQDLLWEDAQRAFRAVIGEIEAAGDAQKKTGWMRQAWHRRVTWIRWLKALQRYCENQHTMALAHIVAERAAADALRSLPPQDQAVISVDVYNERIGYYLREIQSLGTQLSDSRAEVARLTQVRDKQLAANQEADFNCINCDDGLTKETWKWLGPNVGPFCDRCITGARGAAEGTLGRVKEDDKQ